MVSRGIWRLSGNWCGGFRGCDRVFIHGLEYVVFRTAPHFMCALDAWSKMHVFIRRKVTDISWYHIYIRVFVYVCRYSGSMYAG